MNSVRPGSRCRAACCRCRAGSRWQRREYFPRPAGFQRADLAIVPGEATDPVLTALQAVDVEFANLPTGEPIRSNITVVDPDGTTTKLNAPALF